jgi:hypothetical protein
MSVSVSGNTNIVTVTQPTTQVVRVVTAGPRGPEGIQGVQGIQGLPGEGTQGAVGLQGTPGESIQGITGVQGAIGSQGSTGTQGNTGQGTQGIIGETGIQGIQGTAGEGTQGATGETGIQGTAGIQGIAGEAGIQGITGLQGAEGIQGPQGIQGVGIQGPAGDITSIDTGSFATTGSNSFNGNQIINGSVTATSFVGSGSQLTNVATKITGTWTIPPGASTRSFTVDWNRSYQMWVIGNIPNGIISWTATVNVTNSNVPVVGNQYGWYYPEGNALVLTSIPPQIVGVNGAISTTAFSTTTSNTFEFGIINNSGTSQQISWGYIIL